MNYFQILFLLRSCTFITTPLQIVITCLSFAILTGCAPYPVEQDKKELINPIEKMVQAKPVSAVKPADKAVDVLSQTTKTYPNSKDSWLELAQLHFEAGDYGKAISAAQEVIQRDANDRHAYGILVIAGLRVANTSLSKLPKDGDKLAESAKNEVEILARSLRESFQKTESVSQPVSGTPSHKSYVRKSKGSRSASSINGSSLDASNIVKTKKSQSSESSSSVRVSNPFQALQ